MCILSTPASKWISSLKATGLHWLLISTLFEEEFDQHNSKSTTTHIMPAIEVFLSEVRSCKQCPMMLDLFLQSLLHKNEIGLNELSWLVTFAF